MEFKHIIVQNTEQMDVYFNYKIKLLFHIMLFTWIILSHADNRKNVRKTISAAKVSEYTIWITFYEMKIHKNR